MSDKISYAKRKHSLFGSASVRGAGTSIRAIKKITSRTFGALSERFIFTSTRSFGAFGLTYGLLSLFLYFSKTYLQHTLDINPAYMAMGIICCAISSPLLFFDKPMCLFLQDFFVTDFIFFEFFSLKRMDTVDSVPGFSVVLSVILGIIPAVIGIFVSPFYVLFGLFLLVFVFTSIRTPEFPVIFALLAAPYLSPIPDKGLILASISLLSFLSFAIKVITGKRAYHFEIYDALFFLISVIFFIGGFVNDDVSASLVMIALTLSYVPVSNIIVNRRLADCAVNALIISSLPISAASFIQYVFSFSGKLQYKPASLFASSDAYAAFVLIALVLSFFFAKEKKNPVKKALYYLVAALHLSCVAFSWKISLWLTVLIMIIAYAVLSARKIRKETLFLLLIAPYAMLFLPEGIFKKASEIFSVSPSISERLSAWSNGLRLVGENFFFGLGFGAGASVTNTFISLALNFGLPILALLLIIFILRIIQFSLYGTYMRGSLLEIMSLSCTAVIFGLFSLGAWVNVFSDITIYFIFILLFGIFSASLRIARNEYEERLSYYKDLRSVDSSDVNVRLSR